LAELGDGREVIVAAPGKARWPGAVTASCGPRMRGARAGRRVVAVPIVRPLQITGLTADPLPKPVATAGRQIAAHLPPDVAMPPDQRENERRHQP
jgi:hypothetical protein